MSDERFEKWALLHHSMRWDDWFIDSAKKGTLADDLVDSWAAWQAALAAQPATSADYAMGYAEGFNDACKPAQPVEPVAWMGRTQNGTTIWARHKSDTDYGYDWQPLYAVPPAPAAVPLTEGQVLLAIQSLGVDGQGRVALTYESGPYDIDKPTVVAMQLIRAVERAHGIGDKS